MARYKIGSHRLKTAAGGFDRHVFPGSFEHALCYLVDRELDFLAFHARYKNDTEGAPAFDPAASSKSFCMAYSRGIISRRRIEIVQVQRDAGWRFWGYFMGRAVWPVMTRMAGQNRAR